MAIKSKECSVAVYWPEVKAYDNSGQKPLVECSGKNGLVLKTYTQQRTIRCMAIDAAGNMAFCSFKIDVKSLRH